LKQVRAFFTEDRFVMSAIVANAVVLFLLSFAELTDDPTLGLLDYGFTTYFVLEAIFKIARDGFRGYLAVGWNRFDFLLVVVSLPSYALLFVDTPDFSFFLVLRVTRVLKFFRFIRFVPNIGQLIDGVRRAVRASLFVMLAFLLFTFIVSLLSCHFFGPYAPEHFGDPLVAFFSIFRVFTVEGWYEIPDDIAAAAGPAMAFFARAFFMVMVATGGILGLSIVNAIFVDEMLRNENDLFEERLDALHAKIDRLLAERGITGAESPTTIEARVGAPADDDASS
jgi:voltage-gated sodium channel